MNVYRVDKTEQPVVLFQADGTVMRGTVFLSTRTFSHLGQQSVANLFQEKAAFLPFRTEAGSFCVVNKATITHLRYEPDNHEQGSAQTGDASEVLISFAGGEQMRGHLAIMMPVGQNRLIDFINATSGFFLLRNREVHYLVNSALIRDIAPC